MYSVVLCYRKNVHENSSSFSLISVCRVASQLSSVFVLFPFLLHQILNCCPFSLFCPPVRFQSIQFRKHELIRVQGSGSCSFCLKLLIHELHLAQSRLPFNIVSFLSLCCIFYFFFWLPLAAMRARRSLSVNDFVSICLAR